MAEDQVQVHYNHHERKSDEPCEAAVPAAPEAEVEATDRGLFDFVGKKEEEKKCEGEVIASEFDEKVKVSDEKKELEKLHRSTSSSSSSSEEEVEEGGEKKKKKKEKKEKPAQETGEKKGFLDKIKEKLPGGKKAENVATPPPTPAPVPDCANSPGAEGKEKKGFMEKIKEKIPGYSKTGQDKEGACH